MDHLLLDETDATTRVEFAMVEAEFAQRTQWRASAELFRAIDATLRWAAENPEIFVDTEMLRGDVISRDALELATRAAVADLAVRLSLAEATVRSHAHIASTLRERLPALWQLFLDGEVSTANVREAAAIVIELPGDSWAAFDSALVAIAPLTPARFRSRARTLREKLHARTLDERHASARLQRRVWTELDRDGMGWLHAYLPADSLALIGAQLDGLAFDLFREPDETRSMSQLRADALTDLLVGESAPSRPSITVALTIPALTLLGHGNDPALLEGAGPIALDTARRLASGAPSITRLLTDPVTGAVLQMDPRQYRTSAAMRRWFGIRHETCDFPGCGRRASRCDLDHTVAWAQGGATTVGNLAPRCRKHHTMKHHTRWKVEKRPGAEQPTWASPTGFRRDADPPPF